MLSSSSRPDTELALQQLAACMSGEMKYIEHYGVCNSAGYSRSPMQLTNHTVGNSGSSHRDGHGGVYEDVMGLCCIQLVVVAL